jgi:hypothetical protein
MYTDTIVLITTTMLLAGQAGGQLRTWQLKNGNKLTMTITRTAGSF